MEGGSGGVEGGRMVRRGNTGGLPPPNTGGGVGVDAHGKQKCSRLQVLWFTGILLQLVLIIHNFLLIICLIMSLI